MRRKELLANARQQPWELEEQWQGEDLHSKYYTGFGPSEASCGCSSGRREGGWTRDDVGETVRDGGRVVLWRSVGGRRRTERLPLAKAGALLAPSRRRGWQQEEKRTDLEEWGETQSKREERQRTAGTERILKRRRERP
jgi:hypothetical protein